MSKATKDPWEIDSKEISKIESENKKGSSGLPCPKMNVSIDKSCAACEYIQNAIYRKQYPKGHPAREYASQKKAKTNIFMNVVFSANPDKSIILKVGSKAGSAIMDGITKHNWKDIVNPLKDKGREMEISKGKGDSGYNEYPVSPNLEKANWEIPKAVYENLPNLDQDNLLKMIDEGKLTDDNFLDVSSIKMDSTLSFRICPPWTTGSAGAENKRPFTYVWRHWGVSRDQISGDEKMDWESSVTDEDKPEKTVAEVPWEKDVKVDTPENKDAGEGKEQAENSNPKCLGNKTFFDIDDKLCTECPVFKSCGKMVMNA